MSITGAIRASAKSALYVVKTTLSLNLGSKRRFNALLALSLMLSVWQAVTLSLMLPVAQEFVSSGGASDSWYVRTIVGWFAWINPEQRQLFGTLALLASKLFENLLYFIYYSFVATYLKDVLHGYRSMMFKNLMDFPMSYFNHERVGNLIQWLGDEVFRCRKGLVHLMEAFRSVFSAVVYTALLLVISPKLTGLLVSIGLLVFVFDYAFLRTLSQLTAKCLDSRLRVTSALQENISGVRETKLLNLKSRIVSAFEKVSLDAAELERKFQFLILLQAPVFKFMSFLAAGALVLAYALDIAGVRGIGVPALVVYMVITNELVNDIMVFYNNWTNLNLFVPAIPGLNQMARAKDLQKESTGLLTPAPLLNNRIAFENVTLEYPSRGPILTGLSLEIRRGERIALVGESGSGKTSIINLLVRLFDPTSGRVSIDGVDLRDFNLEHLRSRIGVISQDVFLFNASIRENISLGNPAAPQAAIVEAARKAHADQFIAAMPAGYDTVTGERGVQLSGGQKQRIAIAQVFLKDPEIIIFDEATSAVDAQAEYNIQNEIAQIGREKTIILVAHRLSTVKNVDRIYVMDRGRIVESGTWDQLLSQKGSFAQMIGTQTLTAPE